MHVLCIPNVHIGPSFIEKCIPHMHISCIPKVHIATAFIERCIPRRRFRPPPACHIYIRHIPTYIPIFIILNRCVYDQLNIINISRNSSYRYHVSFTPFKYSNSLSHHHQQHYYHNANNIIINRHHQKSKSYF